MEFCKNVTRDSIAVHHNFWFIQQGWIWDLALRLVITAIHIKTTREHCAPSTRKYHVVYREKEEEPTAQCVCVFLSIPVRTRYLDKKRDIGHFP